MYVSNGTPKKGCTDFPLPSEVFHNPLVSLARLRLAFSPFARFMAGALAAGEKQARMSNVQSMPWFSELPSQG